MEINLKKCQQNEKYFEFLQILVNNYSNVDVLNIKKNQKFKINFFNFLHERLYTLKPLKSETLETIFELIYLG